MAGEKSTEGNVASNKYIVDMLLPCAVGTDKPRPPNGNEKSEMQVVPVELSILDGLSSIRIYIPKDLRPSENRQTVGRSLKEVQKRFPDGIPLLDPIEDMQIEDDTFKKTY